MNNQNRASTSNDKVLNSPSSSCSSSSSSSSDSDSSSESDSSSHSDSTFRASNESDDSDGSDTALSPKIDAHGSIPHASIEHSPFPMTSTPSKSSSAPPNTELGSINNADRVY